MKKAFLTLLCVLTLNSCAMLTNGVQDARGDKTTFAPVMTSEAVGGVSVGAVTVTNGNGAPLTSVRLYVRGLPDFAPLPGEPCTPAAPGFYCILPDVKPNSAAAVRYVGQPESAQLRYFVNGKAYLRSFYRPAKP